MYFKLQHPRAIQRQLLQLMKGSQCQLKQTYSMFSVLVSRWRFSTKVGNCRRRTAGFLLLQNHSFPEVNWPKKSSKRLTNFCQKANFILALAAFCFFFLHIYLFYNFSEPASLRNITILIQASHQRSVSLNLLLPSCFFSIFVHLLTRMTEMLLCFVFVAKVLLIHRGEEDCSSRNLTIHVK